MLADPVARFLAQQGLVDYTPAAVSAGAWPCFLDELPDRPDQAVMVRDTDGLEPQDLQPYDTLGLQVAVRGTRDLRASETKGWAIYSALEGLGATVMAGGVYVVRCLAQQPPTRLGPDAAGRHRHAVNFLVEARVPTTHRSE